MPPWVYVVPPPSFVPSVVAGSPGEGVAPPLLPESVPANVVLKTSGNSVPGWPLAISARPDSGPKEYMNVWVPSPIVEYPSPPEICWHLMAPFTFELGIRYPAAGLLGFVDL